MRVVKLNPLRAKYLLKFYKMAEEWSTAKRRRVPLIEIKTSPRDDTRGKAGFFPPLIKLWVDDDEEYATYLFLHEFAHIVKGPTAYHEENHGDRYLKVLAEVVDFFGFDSNYVAEKEYEYLQVRMFDGGS